MKPAVPRRKAWRPKVKTGCLTCRHRRIKCDEAKPHCVRCTSTGRKCDGYELSENVERKSTSPTSILMSHEPSLYIGTPEERKSFYFFQTFTATEFAGFFDGSVFFAGTLQASQFQPEIRHALTALGAMHQKFLCGHAPVVPDDPLDKQVRFALQQCNQSINHLIEKQKASAQPERETIVTLCMLYFSFACLQGDNAQGLEHLKAALYILNDLQELDSPGSSPSPFTPLTVTSIRAAFVGLDTMARAMLPDDNLRTWIASPTAAEDLGDPPDEFESLAEASLYLEQTFNRLLNSTQTISHAQPSPVTFAEAQRKQRLYSSRFKKAGAALESFVERNTLNQKQKKTVSMLRLYRSVASSTLLILSQCPMHGELAWDLAEPSFKSIIECSARILGATDLDALASTIQRAPGLKQQHSDDRDEFYAEACRIMNIESRNPSFSCRFGVCFPLYLVSARCRDPILRRKALALLLHYPRREGLWDGILAGRIALECVSIEENAVNGLVQKASDIAEHHRIRGVSIRYRGPRAANVTFQTVGQAKRNEPGLVKYVVW